MYLRRLLMAFVASFLPSPVMSTTELQCDVENGWKPYCNYCYFFSGYIKNWFEAEDYCLANKAHLASFHSKEELDFLTNLVRQSGEWHAWVGLSIDWWNMVFYWTKYFYFSDKTTPDYFRWDKGEPNNKVHVGREECVEVYRSGYLNDRHCKSRRPFICKKAKDFRPPPPTCNCPTCNCPKFNCPKFNCPKCTCPKCTCPTSAPSTPCPTLEPTTCASLPPPTCATIPPPTLPPLCPNPPPAQLPTSGPGNVTLGNENSSLALMPDDVKGSCMLVASHQSLGFAVDLLGHLSAGRSIAIRGRVKPSAEGLTFTMITADDVAMHLAFLIQDQKIEISSMLNGTQETEEKTVDSFPFGPGNDFEIIIQCDVDRFHATVNDDLLLDFPNRVGNLQSITTLTIWRDLSLADVRLM